MADEDESEMCWEIMRCAGKEMSRKMPLHHGFSLVEVMVAAALVAIVWYFVQSQRGDERKRSQRQEFYMRMLHVKDAIIFELSGGYGFFPPLEKSVYYACYDEGTVKVENHNDVQDFAVWSREEVHKLFICMDQRLSLRRKAAKKESKSKKKEIRCLQPGVADGSAMCGGARYVGFVDPDPEQSLLHIQVMSFNKGTGEAVSRLRTTMPRNSGY